MKEEISRYLEKIKNNWIVKLIKLLIGLAVILILTQFIFIMLIKIIPHSFVQYAMSVNNDNSTIAEMHISVADNLLLFAITCVYAIFTWYLVSESKKAIAQSKREQHIRDIENRLEKFYIPAQNTLKIADEFLKNPTEFTKWTEEVISYQRGDYDNDTTPEKMAIVYAVEKLKEIEHYRFLAEEKTCRLFIKYIYEEETNENRLELSSCIQRDVKDYLFKLSKEKE